MSRYKIRARFPMDDRQYRNAIRRYQRARRTWGRTWDAIQKRYKLTSADADSATCSMIESTGATILYLWRMV